MLCFEVLPVFWFTLRSRSCNDGRTLTHSVAKPQNAVSHFWRKLLKNLTTRMVPCVKMECGEGEIKGVSCSKLNRTTFNGYMECMCNSITISVMMRW